MTYRYVDAGVLRLSAGAGAALTGWPDLALCGAARAQRQWLSRVWASVGFAAAVEVASPALAAQVQSLLDMTDPCPRATRAAALSVVRYLLRDTTRATPFGLFAGVAPLHLADGARVQLGPDHVARGRVDPHWLATVVADLQRCPALRRNLALTVDPLAFVRDDRVVLPRRPAAAGPHQSGPSTRLSRPVAAVLRLASAWIGFDDLSRAVGAAFPRAGAEVVERMLGELLDIGFLVSELSPPLTEPAPLDHVIKVASRAEGDADPNAAAVLQELREIRDLLARHAGPITTVNQHGVRKAAIARMRRITAGDRPLGIDIRVDADVTVPLTVGEEGAAAAAVLVRLAPDPDGTPAWCDYHRRFLDRYGIGAVVPLHDLLHAARGLGYPAGFQDTNLPTPAREDNRTRDRRAQLLATVAHAAAWDRRHDVELTDADLDRLGEVDGPRAVPRPQPHTELRAEVHAPTRAHLDSGNFRLLVVGASRAGGTVTGRFLDLLDPLDTDRLTRAYRTMPTVTAGALRVQVAGPPSNPAAGPIACSTTVLAQQIAVGGAPPAGAVPMSDIGVSADVKGLYLLRLSTMQPLEAVTFSAIELVRSAHPTLRFLTELATGTCAPCAPFTWDAHLRELPHLPRIRYGRSILSPARWVVRRTDLPRNSDVERLQAWRDRWGVPTRVVLGEHDRRLGLDLSEPAHQHVLQDTLHRRGRVTLWEGPPPQAYGWIDGRAHELVLPLAATTPAAHPPRPRATATAAPAPRHLPGAGEWLYACLPCRPDQQTGLLTTHLPRLQTELAAALGSTPQWWFIRQTAPEHHVRLRVRIPQPSRLADAMAGLGAWASALTAAGVLGGLRLDTYLPETGRFGSSAALQCAEAVFVADSAAALAQLACTAADASPRDHQALTAASLLDLACAFNLTDGDGRQWLLQHAPRRLPTPPDRGQCKDTLALTDPSSPAFDAVDGGKRVRAAWTQRRHALVAYRSALGAAGIDPLLVLPDLLHLHHIRVAAPSLDAERVCLHLARTAALSLIERSRPAA